MNQHNCNTENKKKCFLSRKLIQMAAVNTAMHHRNKILKTIKINKKSCNIFSKLQIICYIKYAIFIHICVTIRLFKHEINTAWYIIMVYDINLVIPWWTVPSTNIGTLDKFEQSLSFWSFTKKKNIHKIITYHWKHLKVGRKSHDEENVFLQWMLATIIGTPRNSYE